MNAIYFGLEIEHISYLEHYLSIIALSGPQVLPFGLWHGKTGIVTMFTPNLRQKHPKVQREKSSSILRSGPQALVS